jgi:GxxExxY protein
MADHTLSQVNALTQRIIGAAIQVHRTLGPGLLESVYLACLLYELRAAGLSVETQHKVPIHYGDVQIDCGYRIDALVEATVIVEVKSIAELAPIHEAQLLTYLRLSNRPVGLLINFNTKVLTHGVRRLINGWLPP